MGKVLILRVENADNLEEAVREAVRFTGFRAKGTVIVKPNICMVKYYPGAVTNPGLIMSLVGVIRDSAEEVIVGESDGYNYSCSQAFRMTGIEEAVRKAGGRTLNFSTDKAVQLRLRNSRVKGLLLPKTLLEADALVDMPVMKTHEFTIYSGAIKNLFGLIPDEKRIYLHPYFNEVMLKLFQLLRPKLTLMDALTAMEGNGPTRGLQVKLDLILASSCALSLDMVAAEIMGLDWRRIDHLNYIASHLGFEEDQIEVEGCRLEEVKRVFALPRMDLPVKMQHMIFRHVFLTKLLFCNRNFIKMCQKLLTYYRRFPAAV